MAEAIDDIRMQLVNNRIDTEELKERLQSGIADPLKKIGEEMFPELERTAGHPANGTGGRETRSGGSRQRQKTGRRRPACDAARA